VYHIPKKGGISMKKWEKLAIQKLRELATSHKLSFSVQERQVIAVFFADFSMARYQFFKSKDGYKINVKLVNPDGKTRKTYKLYANDINDVLEKIINNTQMLLSE